MASRLLALAAAVGLLAAACCTQTSPPGGSSGSSGATAGHGTGGSGSTGGTTGATAGTGGGGAPCGLNSLVCAGVCTDVLVDPGNCGGCGVACGPSQVCAAGVCGAPSSCPEGTTACRQTCVDLQSDDANCGSCGNVCPAGQGCAGGSCAHAIPLGDGGPTCPGGGPPVTVTFDGGSACTGSIAQVTFRWALCSCSTVETNGDLVTDAFDSATGPYVDGGVGGGVGANQSCSATGSLDVGGSLWAETGISPNAPSSSVGIELHDGTSFTPPGTFSVAADAYVDGNVAGQLAVGGKLFVPAGATVASTVTAASVVTGPVTVPPPCDCSPGQLVDVAGIVAAGATSNDDAAIGLDPNALNGPNGALRLDLPCGRYYLAAIKANGNVAIAVHGRVALFIGGDVQPTGTLTFTLDPDATLDVFIAGDLVINGGGTFGSTLVPSQSRFYVAGSKVILNGPLLLAGNFYLPNASLAPNGDVHAYGSLFTGSYQANGATVVHYDVGILAAGGECADAGAPVVGDGGSPSGDGGGDGGSVDAGGGSACASCRDCGNQACVNGACGACATSADCCAPLVCVSGTCTVSFK